MMVNCPKCNLLQPKDTYCARCGVNMETWQPPPTPFWKKLLKNWMVQLGLLFTAILALVIWDNISSHQKSSSPTSLPPVTDSISRQDSPAQSQSQEVQSQAFSQATPKPELEPQNKNVAAKLPVKNDKQPLMDLHQKVSLKMMTMLPATIETLARTGRRIDENIYVVERRQNFISHQRKGIKGFGTTIRKNFVFNQPVELFLGEQDEVSGTSIGFFAQVTVAEGSTSDSINAEIRFWHQLKLSGEMGSPTTVEVNLKPQDELFIIDLAAHDLEFTPDELALFESSRKLNGLSFELFAENLSEMVVLLQLQ